MPAAVQMSSSDAFAGDSSGGEQYREYDSASVAGFDLRHAGLRLARPESMASLRSSINRHGVLHPLVVNREADALVLLDGFKRLEILSERKDATAPIRVLSLRAEQAKAALVTLNRPHRGLCDLEEAWVVASLVRDHNLSQTDVAQLLGRHKSWVCRRLLLVERLEPNVVDDIRLGLVSATVARELVKLPRGNQPQVAEAVRRHGLTSRQTNELVTRLLQSEFSSHAAVLEDPLRFLASEPKPKRPPKSRDPRLSNAGEKLRCVLIELEHRAMAANRALRTSSLNKLRGSDLEVLAPLAQAIVPLLRDDITALGQVVVETDRCVDDET